ncbi:Ornithine cyclodeaminase [Candidatus Sulfopaludibacter sp. SbA4]|nr:Ornithine cyclodeaminase [Candidatus Sulfopaludibacter sp. SbA4]
MRILNLPEIRPTLAYPEVIHRMRDALIANSRGECDTPTPMHLDIAPVAGEVHIKSSYRRGGRYFALKIASTFPQNLTRGLPTGNGMMLLASAETGEPVAFLADAGHLTDVRTAAVAAMVARELHRTDTAIGILGAGVQARLQAQMHAEVLDLHTIWICGRTPERAAECRSDLQALLPRTEVLLADSPARVASECRLIVTCTASRQPLLSDADLKPGTHISAVGSDSPGKQELDPGILRRAALLLADSRRQCEKLGELQHAPETWERAVEIGTFCERPQPRHDGLTVCDFTGLGVEDLYIAEYCYERSGF